MSEAKKQIGDLPNHYAVGNRVEVVRRNKRRPGVISAVHEPTSGDEAGYTYDIDFDSGIKERDVRHELIRLPGAEGEGDGSSRRHRERSSDPPSNPRVTGGDPDAAAVNRQQQQDNDNETHQQQQNNNSDRNAQSPQRKNNNAARFDALKPLTVPMNLGLENKTWLFSCLRQSLFCNLGYRMDTFQRQLVPGPGGGGAAAAGGGREPLYYPERADGWALGVKIEGLLTGTPELMGLVRPMVRVHIVNIETGMYLKSKRRPLVSPVTTSTCPLKDAAEVPNWHEELIPDVGYSDVVNEEALILFEILDNKPSLSIKGGSARGRQPKKVAWGYLLPIGVSGTLNVGIKRDWTPQYRPAAAQGEGRNKRERTTRRGRSREEQNKRDSSAERQLRSEEEEDDNDATDGTALLVKTDPQQQHREAPEDPVLRQRIQLYSYRKDEGVVGALQRILMGWPSKGDSEKAAAVTGSKDPRKTDNIKDLVPEVYLQWRLQRRIAIHYGVLSVVLGPASPQLGLGFLPLAQPVGGDILGGEQESPSKFSRRGGGDEQSVVTRGASGKEPSRVEIQKIKTAVLKRSRAPKEPCVVPNRLLKRVDVGPNGAMVVSFSHCGHFLAIAAESHAHPAAFSQESTLSPSPGNVYSLQLLDTDTGKLVWAENFAHHGVIYDIKWSKDDCYILTASSDGTCKLWDTFALSHTMGYGLFRGGGRGVASQPGTTHGSIFMMNPGSSTPGGGGGGGGDMSTLGGLPTSMVPYLRYTLAATPPLFVYCAVFQEYAAPSVPLPPPSGIPGIFAPTTTTGGGGVNDSFEQQYSGTNAGVRGGPPTEYMDGHVRAVCPRVITGSADGRLRVWDGESYLGCIKSERSASASAAAAAARSSSAGNGVGSGTEDDADGGDDDFAPHDGKVQAIAIDERTKYLFSGDSAGDILVWRADTRGWYRELLRKFKRDLSPSAALALNPNESNSPIAQGVSGITTLMMHPDKFKAQLLTMSTEPSSLKVYSTATYRAISNCAGSTMAGLSAHCPGGSIWEADGKDLRPIFSRGTLSADGRVVACGCPASGSSTILRMWDAQTGAVMPSALSDILLPYPVRSVAWHPKQHVVAVAMVGPGAAVAVYSGERESTEKAVARINRSNLATVASLVNSDSTSLQQHQQHRFNLNSNTAAPANAAAAAGLGPSADNTNTTATAGQQKPKRAGLGGGGVVHNSATAPSSSASAAVAGTGGDHHQQQQQSLPPVKESVRALRSEKARDILDKVRAARGIAS